jgi:hypothetical protein
LREVTPSLKVSPNFNAAPAAFFFALFTLF